MGIRASFYSSIHQGWLAREVYILPLYLSLEDWPHFFFFIAACRNWFLVVYYEAECLRAVSADTVCRLVLGDTECYRRKIIKDWRKKDRMAHAHKIAQ